MRVNTSHGTPEIRDRWIVDLKRVIQAREPNHAYAILVDLRGPRIRVGRMDGPITLAAGDRVTFAPEATVASGEIPTTYDALARDVHPGAMVLLDDGLLSVEVEDVRGSRVIGRVRHGGRSSPARASTCPGSR